MAVCGHAISINGFDNCRWYRAKTPNQRVNSVVPRSWTLSGTIRDWSGGVPMEHKRKFQQKVEWLSNPEGGSRWTDWKEK
jgi:hypothetical protein